MAQAAFVVRGRVINRLGRAVAGATVVAVDKDLRSESELGRVETDQAGQYSIDYATASFATGDIGQADLVVRVLDGNTVKAESPVRFNAGPDENITLILDDRRSEYERIADDLEPELDGVAVVDLTADDVMFLSNDLGWAAQILKLFQLAARLAAQTLSGNDPKSRAVPAEFFYAVTRQGLPGDLGALLQQPPTVVGQAVRASVDADIVPSWVADQLPDIQARLRRRLIEVTAAADQSAPPVSQVFAVLADEKARLELTQLWFDAGDPAQFWERSAASGADTGRLRTAFAASAIVGAHTPLLTGVLNRLSDGAQLEEIVEWDQDTWGKVIDSAGVAIPAGLGDGDAAVARSRYVAALASAAADSFPRRALTHRLTTSTLPDAPRLAQLLREHPEFDLSAGDVREFLGQLADAGKDGLTDNLGDGLASIVRVYRLSPRPEHVETLLAAGLTSARDITRISVDQFVAQFGEPLGKRQAAAIHRRALETHAISLAYLARFRQGLDTRLPAALTGSATSKLKPTWAALFGATDFCECPDCRSALSPSAYLVDLLQFVRHRSAGRMDAMTSLQERRPDLELLALSCANTTTTLPQIDLVIELCESRLGGGPLPVTTDRPSAELAVQPQPLVHSADVYTSLAHRWSPQPLPFDRPWEETRLHLSRLGTTREALLLTLRPSGDSAARALAAERLGIPLTEVGAITGAVLHEPRVGPQSLWGLNDNWMTELARVDTMLARTGLSFEQLQTVLATNFVRGHGGPTLTGAGCALDGWSIGQLNDANLTSLQGFLRLLHRTGLAATQLDDLLTALNGSVLSDAVLTELGQVRWLQTRLSLPIEALTWWWGPLAADPLPGDRPAPWFAVFSDPVRVGRPDPDLELTRTGEPAGNPGTVADHAEAVRAALGVTGSELDRLLTAAPAAALTREHLSALYREVSLARSLHASIADLMAVRRLEQVDILTAQSPSRVAATVDLYDSILRWGWTPTDLAELLTGTPPAGSRPLVDDAATAALQRALLAARQAGQAPIPLDAAALTHTLEQIAPSAATAELSGYFQPQALADTPSHRQRLLELVPELRPSDDFWPTVLGTDTALPVSGRLTRTVQLLLVTRAALATVATAIGTDAGTAGALAELLRLGADGPRVFDALTSDALASARTDPSGRPLDEDTTDVRWALNLLACAVQVMRVLRLGTADLPLVCGHGASNWLDLSELPITAEAPPRLDAFRPLAEFFTRRARRQRPGADWTGLLSAALANPDSASLLPAAAAALSSSESQRPAIQADVAILVGNAAWALETDAPAPDIAARRLAWQDGTALCRIDAALELTATAGVRVATALPWVADTVTAEASSAAVQALRARYPDDQWHQVARPLRDLMRERQRDALVAALVPPGQSVDDLSGDLLMDVSIGACLDTSRIEAAIGSVQTFVQRSLLGLEGDVRFNADAADEWRRWMHSYQLWEANRQIFLYPENYLHPELRDDKTEFFDVLEQQLNQGELDADRIETIFTTYLEQLDAVARLEVCGCFHEQDADDAGLTIDRLHVVARTLTSPRTYWYRCLEGGAGPTGGRWTGWEKLELDLDAEEVVLTIIGGRLLMCWPEFEHRSEPQPPPPAPVLTVVGPDDKRPAQFGAPAPPAPLEHLDVKLAYSVRASTGWQAKRVSDPIEVPPQRKSEADLCASFWSWLLGAGPKFVGLVPGNPPPHDDIMSLIQKIDHGDIPDLAIPQRVRFELADPHEIRLVAAQSMNSTPVTRPQDAVDLRIQVFLRDRSHTDIGLSIGEFDLGGCHGMPKAIPHTDAWRAAVLVPDGAIVAAPGSDTMDVRNDGGYSLYALELTTDFPDVVDSANPDGSLYPIRNDVPLLNGPVGPFRLTLPQGGEFLFDDGFFCAGPTRTFAVRPVWESIAPSAAPAAQTAASTLPFAVAASWWRASADRVIAQLEKTAAGNPARLDVSTVQVLTRAELATRGKAAKEDATLALRTAADPSLVWNALPTYVPQSRRYRFELFQHPYVCRFLVALRRGGIDALLDRRQQQPDDPAELNFYPQYAPFPIVDPDYPRDTVDFTRHGSYSIYNWELFVHAPLLIAQRLQKDQRFEDSLRWHQRIFDPTRHAGDEPSPGRYWNVQPFYDAMVINPVDELAELLTGAVRGVDGESLAQLVADWRANPFEPWRVAELRRLAIPKAVVMSYLDLLLAWGDARFREYRRESIREATMLYLWAAQILGRRPEQLPEQESTDRSYAAIRDDLDSFANAVVAVEEVIPARRSGTGTPPDAAALRALETVFYFCIPPNARLQRYWSDIEDRLFKIRHCQDINGVARPLALFDPPIDPDLLVRAAAAGVDMATVGAHAPISPYRFPVVLAKALELATEVRSLGAALLAALERRDAEQLARLRSSHELVMLDAIRDVRARQVDEVTQARTALQRSKDIAIARQQHYQTLIAEGQTPGESEQLLLLEAAAQLNIPQAALENLASTLQLIPEFSMGVEGFGGSPKATMSFGGSKIAGAVSGQARVLALTAQLLTGLAGVSGIRAGYDRRLQEWRHQLDLATRELTQLDAQLAAADVRVAVAQRELDNHDLQARQAREMDSAMRSKFTNQELYTWMSGQLSDTYFAAYTVALEAARRAESTYQYEHPERSDTFVSVGGWDSLHQGLLSGERLHADLRRMEAAWLTANEREFELTKQVSLAMLAPDRLVELRTHGRCSISLPETLFDADHPGHYLRRLRSVSLTVPAVVGPYSSVNCELTLTSSRVRVDPSSAEPYAQEAGSTRFRSYNAAVSAIATSRGHSDSGLFELSFRDERYLPFEGAGAISEWELVMDPACNDFDIQSVTDVIMELSYTARNGGKDLRDVALQSTIAARSRNPQYRLFSARTDFADAWYQFLHPITAAEGQTLELSLDASRFPFRAQQRTITPTALRIALVLSAEGRAAYPTGADSPALGILVQNPAGHTVTVDRDGTDLVQRFVRTDASDVVVPLAADITLPRGSTLGTWRIVVPQSVINVLPDGLVTTPPGQPKRLRQQITTDLLVVTQTGR